MYIFLNKELLMLHLVFLLVLAYLLIYIFSNMYSICIKDLMSINGAVLSYYINS